MKIYKYKNKQDYIQSQINGIYSHPTVKDNVNYEWAEKKDFIFINKVILKDFFYDQNLKPQNGVCHGAKLGKENQWFEEVTGINFIGTDIVMETNEEMKLINWDFHNLKKEWKSYFDVVYSNALDHARDPVLALTNWKKSLSERGICILEHTKFHEESTPTDPFGATLEEYEEMLKTIDVNLIKIYSTNLKHNKKFIVFKQ